MQADGLNKMFKELVGACNHFIPPIGDVSVERACPMATRIQLGGREWSADIRYSSVSSDSRAIMTQVYHKNEDGTCSVDAYDGKYYLEITMDCDPRHLMFPSGSPPPCVKAVSDYALGWFGNPSHVIVTTTLTRTSTSTLLVVVAAGNVHFSVRFIEGKTMRYGPVKSEELLYG